MQKTVRKKVYDTDTAALLGTLSKQMNPPEKAKFLRRVLSDLLIFCVLYETEKRNAVKKTLIYPCSLDKDILYDRFAAHPLDLQIIK